MRNRLIVTGTAAAMVLTAGIVGAVAVQPGQDQDRETTAAPVAPDALQGLPPMMVKRDPTSRPGKNSTVDVRSNRAPQGSLFTYTPPPAATYTPKHMADSYTDQPGSPFTMRPPPAVDVGNGTWPSIPEAPSDRPTVKPTPPPTQGPTTPPAQSPEPTPTPTPTPTPEPTPTPTPEPTPEPTDPPSEEPVGPPAEEPTEPPPAEPTVEPTTEPSEEPVTEPGAEPSTGPTE
ncbi:hypothetical protein [Promicromonospora umidemergens]|uniref:hypothetical protein n=1 Tax=Promicromonospora umidemergens TaxID=629679 RepID=UPI0020A4DA78|nr:hypothetical protein [Promicromonospora umidemergens]